MSPIDQQEGILCKRLKPSTILRGLKGHGLPRKQLCLKVTRRKRKSRREDKAMCREWQTRWEPAT